MNNESWCPKCGPGVDVDEDGYCHTCGNAAEGPGVDQIYSELEKSAESLSEPEKHIRQMARGMMTQWRQDYNAKEDGQDRRRQHESRAVKSELRNVESHRTYITEVAAVREAKKREIERHALYKNELTEVSAYRKQDIEVKTRTAAAIEGILALIRLTAGIDEDEQPEVRNDR